MQGVYFSLIGNVPYEAAAIDNTYPGMQTYIKAMNKYEPAFTYNGVALQGWQSAALLAAGGQGRPATTSPRPTSSTSPTNHQLHRRRPDHGDQLGDGPHQTTYPTCSAFVQVEGKKFVPVLGQGEAGLRLLGPERRRTRCRCPPRPAPRGRDPGHCRAPVGAGAGVEQLPGLRHPRHPLRLHLRHGGRGAGAHLPGHRGLQLRLRRPGLHLGLHLHPAGAERAHARSGWPSFLVGRRAGAGARAGLRPLPVPQDPQHQHHGQAGHRDHPVRGHPRPAAGHLRQQQPVQPAEHPVQPGHRLLPRRPAPRSTGSH